MDDLLNTLKQKSVIRSYIISESLLWSAWNAVFPLFAVFITTQISGGNIESAGIAYSIYLLFRVIFELTIGNFLHNATDRKKFAISVIGLSLMSIAYTGFVFAQSIWFIFVLYSLLGVGMGIASPAKNSLFSTHLDKRSSAGQWASYDAVTFLCMAISAAIGGLVVNKFGFQTLFIMAAILNLLSTIPYIYKRKIL